MNELRLLFHRDPAADAYHVRAVGGLPPDPDARATAADPSFSFALTGDDFEDLRWYLEDYMELPDGGAIVRARRIEGNLREWGRGLHAAAFPADSENASRLKELLAGPEPRALTVATADAGLLRLPWELMEDDAGPLSNRLSVRRQLEKPEPGDPPAAVLPLRILYVVSRPADTGFLDPRLTTRSVLDALDPLGASVQVDFCRPATLARMTEMLAAAERSGKPYHIVHFDGHGTYDKIARLGALCFEKPDDGSGEPKTDLVHADRLGGLLAARRVPLAVLEACRSSTIDPAAAVFRSVAPRLIQAGVGSVLSMGYAVHVEAARLLLDRFYRELVAGAAVGQAVARARDALMATPARWIEYGPGGRTVALQDWFLPHLYQRGTDAALVPPAGQAAADAVPARPFDVFLSHNHADKDRVRRLAAVLVEKHKFRVWLDLWERRLGPLEELCAEGIRDSRYTIVVGSERGLASKWVQWEIDRSRERDPTDRTLLPLLFEDVKLPPDLDRLFWVDCRDPAAEEEQAKEIATLIRDADAAFARARRGYRPPAGKDQKDEAGAFPAAPMYGFQGRARELHALERQFRTSRGVLLHAMGGMGKTTLATEAAHWWTRSGLFRDGACFVSFEQPVPAERVVSVLGTYLTGPKFETLPESMQRQRAVELFDQKDVLLVWDNFESVLPQFNADGTPDAGAALYGEEERGRLFDLFRDLTANPTGRGRLLVTCRPGETGLPGARKTELEGLARPDSLWLVSRVIEKDGLTLDDPRLGKDKLGPLLDALADHPLSIELVCPHLAKMTPEEIVADFGTLVETFRRGAGVERNESLRASLAFSTRRLSAAAQAALPWLGLFSGGVFEDNLLDVSQIDAPQWEAVRAELEATALLRVERDMMLAGRPYLRFHPTLAYAAAGRLVPDADAASGRLVDVYRAVTGAVAKALHGSNARGGMGVMGREEANVRTAVRRACAAERYAEASAMGDTVRDYLERSGRLRERDGWAAWLAAEVRKGGFSAPMANRERDAAWAVFAQGRAAEAVQRLEALLARLRAATDFDPAFQLAAATVMLGRVYYTSGHAGRAVPVIKEAIALCEALVGRAGPGGGEAERANLAAALGDLANALRAAGRLDEALAPADRALEIVRGLGHEREVAAGLGRRAAILRDQGRHAEADAGYEQAVAAARQAGDRELEGTVLQHQGGLAIAIGQHARAAGLFGRALGLFQEMGNEGGVMQTCNSLGVVEQELGRLAEAMAWYGRSREIAGRRGDVKAQAAAAQNIGIVRQEEGEAARRAGREADARLCFEEARREIADSLRLRQQLGNDALSAESTYQLGVVYAMLGQLDEAERCVHLSREISERLGLPDLWKDYGTLAEIARRRGDAAGAAAWEAKRDAKRAELDRLAHGPTPGGVPPRLLEPVQALAIACGQAAANRATLEPGAADALDTLDKMPPPLPELSAFLRRVAGGESPAVPGGLPGELAAFLGQLLDAVRNARGT